MTDALRSRVRRRWQSRSGVVHTAYVCDGREFKGPCPRGVHAVCDHYMALVRPTGKAVDCKRCRTTHGWWFRVVMEATHPEIAEVAGR